MYLDFAKIPIYALVLKKCLTLIENILYNILGVMYLEEIMFLNNFFEKFSGRLCWNVNFFTFLEVFLIILTPFMVKYANPELFIEGNVVENLQLVILVVAFCVAFRAPKDKKMFRALALVVILLLMRETNLGRGYFCAKYLSPEDICRWKNLKYGFFVEPLRNLYGLFILYYVWRQKVYKVVGQYMLKAPLFVWDLSIFVGAVVTATFAEWPQIDNVILEESFETLMYVAFLNCLYRYERCKIKNSEIGD